MDSTTEPNKSVTGKKNSEWTKRDTSYRDRVRLPKPDKTSPRQCALGVLDSHIETFPRAKVHKNPSVSATSTSRLPPSLPRLTPLTKT